jgi:hypothetical protein
MAQPLDQILRGLIKGRGHENDVNHFLGMIGLKTAPAIDDACKTDHPQ